MILVNINIWRSGVNVLRYVSYASQYTYKRFKFNDLRKPRSPFLLKGLKNPPCMIIHVNWRPERYKTSIASNEFSYGWKKIFDGVQTANCKQSIKKKLGELECTSTLRQGFFCISEFFCIVIGVFLIWMIMITIARLTMKSKIKRDMTLDFH